MVNRDNIGITDMLLVNIKSLSTHDHTAESVQAETHTQHFIGQHNSGPKQWCHLLTHLLDKFLYEGQIYGFS